MQLKKKFEIHNVRSRRNENHSHRPAVCAEACEAVEHGAARHSEDSGCVAVRQSRENEGAHRVVSAGRAARQPSHVFTSQIPKRLIVNPRQYLRIKLRSELLFPLLPPTPGFPGGSCSGGTTTCSVELKRQIQEHHIRATLANQAKADEESDLYSFD